MTPPPPPPPRRKTRASGRPRRYPVVAGDALRDVFQAAGIRFQVRNMAMGGVPSFPNSVCMRDNFGGDADVIVWDFRMVERSPENGELYIRQALMMPRRPFVLFKRNQPYLRKDVAYAHALGGANGRHLRETRMRFARSDACGRS